MITKIIFLLLFLFCFNIQAEKLTEKQIIYFCLMAEGRGEGLQGIDAIANIIINRYNNNLKYKSISDVCLEKYQFSCFLEYNKISAQISKELKENNKKTIEISEYCQKITNNILNNRPIKRILNKKTLHYCTINCFPKWRNDNKIEKIIGNHVFFKGII